MHRDIEQFLNIFRDFEKTQALQNQRQEIERAEKSRLLDLAFKRLTPLLEEISSGLEGRARVETQARSDDIVSTSLLVFQNALKVWFETSSSEDGSPVIVLCHGPYEEDTFPRTERISYGPEFLTEDVARRAVLNVLLLHHGLPTILAPTHRPCLATVNAS